MNLFDDMLSTMDARKEYFLDSKHLKQIQPCEQQMSMFGIGRGVTFYRKQDLEKLAISVHGADVYHAKVEKRKRRMQREREMKEAVEIATKRAREEVLAKRSLQGKENPRTKVRRTVVDQPDRPALGVSTSENVRGVVARPAPVQPIGYSGQHLSASGTMTSSSSSSSSSSSYASALMSSRSGQGVEAKIQANQQADEYELKASTRANLVKSLRIQIRRMLRNSLSVTVSGHPQMVQAEATLVLPEVFASFVGSPDDPMLRTFSRKGQVITYEASCMNTLECKETDIRRSVHNHPLRLSVGAPLQFEYNPSKFLLRVKGMSDHDL